MVTFELLLFIIIALVGISTLLVLLFNLYQKNRKYETKYARIINIDSAVEKSKAEKQEIENIIDELRGSYKEKKDIYDTLIRQAAIYDEEIQLADLGFYKPHYDFDTSDIYKEKINNVREKQKKMISKESAIYCHEQWTVEGSRAKGRTMTNRGIRLTARAFNNECDSAISNARWNNMARMESRIEKAFNTINKLNESNKIFIDHKYFLLKMQELRLTHEYKEKKQIEKEEQAEIKRQMREEEKLRQETEKVLREEEKRQKLLEQAKREAERTTGAQLRELNLKIESLSRDLEEAQEKSKRALSQAQQTKRGHVYIISNIGSFGENVYKIGMTRRLEPLDRVKELGDASVPFNFDIHAMIYSENAPDLENALHQKFSSLRMNLVNTRREFFDVTLSDIENEVKRLASDAEFIVTAEAREYRESQSIRAQRAQTTTTDSDLPEEL